MPAYVTLPGTSGNYFSTPDINLLGADTAHLEQSAGSWAIDSGHSSSDSQDSTDSYFGAKSFSAVSDGSSTLGIKTSAAGLITGVPASTQVAASVKVKCDEGWGSETLTLPIVEYNGALASLGSPTGSTTTSAEDSNGWKTISFVFTTNASMASLRLFPRISNPVSGRTYRWDGFSIREGSDGSFVRSLRIVNDIEIEWKVALDDYTPTATNTILDCLSSNDGYRIRHTTGDLIEVAYGNGSSTRVQTSSATGLTDGEAHVFKVTVDQSTGAVVYYIDGVQHDTDTMTTGAGKTAINDLVVGANAAASANWTAGDLYYVIVRDGISGLVVAKFDADDWVGI